MSNVTFWRLCLLSILLRLNFLFAAGVRDADTGLGHKVRDAYKVTSRAVEIKWLSAVENLMGHLSSPKETRNNGNVGQQSIRR